MKTTYIKRKHNVITQEKTLESLHTFKNFPIYIGCTDKDQSTDIVADLSIAICKKTGIMQLDKVLPLEVIYGDYHSEALGSLWTEHHALFVDFLNSYKPTNVLEIGGSNGFIAKEAVKKNKKINKWVMVEPAPAYKGNKKIQIIAESFDENFKYTGSIDCVVHSHTFEHIYEPGLFMKQLGAFMKKGDTQIFSVPNLYKYLSNKQANWINFEHNVFLSEHYVDYLLLINGFEILEKKYFYEHSIFYATKKVREVNAALPIDNKYKVNKKLFETYLTFYEAKIDEINKKITDQSTEVYLFGAHIFSQFLMLMGLKGNIVGVLDNSTLKEGKRLYGTNVTVFNPKSIRNKKNITVVLRAGSYQKEIKDQLLIINPSVKILE